MFPLFLKILVYINLFIIFSIFTFILFYKKNEEENKFDKSFSKKYNRIKNY